MKLKGALIICIIIFGVNEVFSQPVQVTRGAYLQQVTTNSIVIRWRTNVPTSSRVDFGTTTDYGKSIINPLITTEHIIKISELEPGTRYYYAIGNKSQLLQSGWMNNFHTAPAAGSSDPVRVWVTGDFGNGSQAQAAVRDAYTNFSQSPTHLWIWLGDNAYNMGLDFEYQDFVFNMYPDQLKQFPIYPTPGNHDYGQVGYQSFSSLSTSFPYFSIFTLPQNGEAGGLASGTPKYYSYDYSNIHFVSLDSYGAKNDPESDMYKWLARDLTANKQKWIIVYFHHPPFSKGTHDSDIEKELIDMRTHIVPLLETFRVDLVLSGHSHCNERSYLIRGHYGPSNSFDSSMMKMSYATNYFEKRAPFNGTVYAVCGTSGQLAGGPEVGGPMPCMYFNDYNSNCSMVIDVNDDLLSARYLSSTGTIPDEFTIRKAGVLNQNQSSFEISFHPTDNKLYFSLYLPENNSIEASAYNMLGEKITEFNKFPGSLAKGYHVLSADIVNTKFSPGVYLINFHIGDHHFSKKVFIKPR